MSKRVWKEMGEEMAEAASDTLYFWAGIIAAPIMAICRVISDFIHGEGHFDHTDRGPRSGD